MDDLLDGLLEELECKICMNYMVPPIRQCETGHSICEPCRNKLARCPLCQGHFTEARNISLESLARKIRYPCQNAKLGCTARLTYDIRDKHETQCSYKGYRCAYPKCPWSGRYEDIVEHWAQKKQTSKPYRAVSVCHTKIQKTESFYVNMVTAYDQLFWYKFKSNNGKLSWGVQFIGNGELAENYAFEIDIFKPGQPTRRFTMSNFCQPDGVDVFQSGGCVMTTLESIGHLLGDDQLLIYYLRVKEVGPEQEEEPSDTASVKSDSSVSRGKGALAKGENRRGQGGQGRRGSSQGQGRVWRGGNRGRGQKNTSDWELL